MDTFARILADSFLNMVGRRWLSSVVAIAAALSGARALIPPTLEAWRAAVTAPAGIVARLLWLAGANLERSTSDGGIERLESTLGTLAVDKVDEAVACIASRDWIDGDLDGIKVPRAVSSESLLDFLGVYSVEQVACVAR
ncbi:hypothetical protein C2857_000343 [Epichloe festucae Fl1]|uniref:Uncharacterized protein n=1 Tax=Epichloe festucae (strain Fl1) TaxID=877507 RepID=A0A7S9KU06_EPIFF|nr:hypothetical protein C2857_000343 [Epichloe festucae Fl1]